MVVINDIEIELPVRGELGRVDKTDLCRAAQVSSRQQLVSEMRKLMDNDKKFESLYKHQFRSWSVSREVAIYFLEHIFGDGATIRLIN